MDVSLLACHQCDTVYRRAVLLPGHAAYCACCGGLLYRSSRISLEQYLALTLTALLICLIAQTSPVMSLALQGVSHSSSLWQALLALHHEGMNLVALLVLVTTTIFPLFELLLLTFILLQLLLPTWRHRCSAMAPRYPLFDIHRQLRALLVLRPWGMIDVFLVAILVALVKLAHTASVVPGIALWAFVMLTFVLALVASIDHQALWTHLSTLEQLEAQAEVAASKGLNQVLSKDTLYASAEQT